MATEVLIPKIGFSMTEGELSEWLVSNGGETVEGEPLFSIESDKSTNEVESPATGKLRILKEAGETYEVGTVIGTIE